jgi:hypothetical protein
MATQTIYAGTMAALIRYLDEAIVQMRAVAVDHRPAEAIGKVIAVRDHLFSASRPPSECADVAIEPFPFCINPKLCAANGGRCPRDPVCGKLTSGELSCE